MTISKDVISKINSVIIESTSTPGQAALVVCNPDGSDISGGGGGSGGGSSFTTDVEITTSSTVGPNLILRNTNTGGYEWRVKSSASADPAGAGAFAIQSYSDGTTPFVILPSSNNVGIGTLTPATALGLGGVLSFVPHAETYCTYGMQMVDVNTAIQWIPSGGIILKSGATGMPGDRGIITSSGDLGLRTLTPAYRLDVNGDFRCVHDANLNANVNVGGETSFTSSSENVVSFGQQLVGTTAVQWIPSGGLDFKYNATGLPGRLNVMLSNGDFGLGINPSYKLDVNGDARFNGNFGVFNTTPVAQQTGGAATASATYGATEQDMLQKVYDCLRTFGFLS